MASETLKLKCYDNSIYLPSGVHARKSVVYDSDRKVLRDSQLLRGENLDDDASETFAVLPSDIADNAKQSEEEVLYLGEIMELHFGHLITEGLRHCWALNRAEVKGLRVPVSRSLSSLKEISRRFIRPHQMKYLDFIKAMQLMEGRLLEINLPTRFSKIWIPQPSWIERYSVDAQHIATLRNIAIGIIGENNIPRDPRPLYFSRSKLPRGYRKIRHEVELEKFLNSDGWRIVYPERLSLREQIRVVNSHDKFAGVIGSAMHLLMFRKDEVPFNTLYFGPSLEKEVYKNYMMMHRHMPGSLHISENSLSVSNHGQSLDLEKAIEALQSFGKLP